MIVNTVGCNSFVGIPEINPDRDPMFKPVGSSPSMLKVTFAPSDLQTSESMVMLGINLIDVTTSPVMCSIQTRVGGPMAESIIKGV